MSKKNNSNIKIAAPIVNIKDWKYGPVIVIIGNTYNIKNELKKMGFKPYKLGNMWVQVMDKNIFDIKDEDEKNKIIESLKSLGINNSEILISTESQENTKSQENTNLNSLKQKSDEKDSGILKGEEYPYRDNFYKDKEERTRKKYSFPIEKNILKTIISLNIDGENKEEEISIHRNFIAGKTASTYNITFNRDYKDYPIYEFEIGKEEDGKPISIIRISTKGKTEQNPWGSYNEKEYLTDKIIPKIKNAIENNKKYKQPFIEYYDKQKRTDDLKQFMKDLENNRGEEKSLYSLTITDGPYKGSYPVSIGYVDDQTVSLKTSIKNNLAPYPASIGWVNIFGAHNLNDLNNIIQSKLQSEESIQKYTKYLQSFPFLENEKNEETNKFNQISNFIENKNIDVELVLRRLKEIGYIRPHKRQKQQGPGISMGEEIKWVLDAEKIRDDIYGRKYIKNSPDFFYSVIAYYVLKAKNDQWSVTDAMLIDSISSWIRTMEKFGKKLDFREIESTISSIGKEILFMVFGKKSQSRTEQFYKFYYGGGFFDDESDSKSQDFSYSANKNISDLQDFARNLGVNPSEMTLKRLYRTLSKLTHPDQNPQDSNAEEKFKQLSTIWNNIPDNLKQAFNWYDKIVMG